jgi:hypothetical protein
MKNKEMEVQKKGGCQVQWLMPVILATQEAEIRGMVVQGQCGQNESETLFQNTQHKKG